MSNADLRKQGGLSEITVPGMIVSGTGSAKEPDTVIRIKKFSLGGNFSNDKDEDGMDDYDEAYELEQLMNREDIIVLDYHKYTFQHSFHVVIMYSEPKKKEEKK